MDGFIWLRVGTSSRALVEKPGGKRQLGRPRHRWEDNIKTDRRVIGRAWTGLIWLRVGTSGRLL